MNFNTFRIYLTTEFREYILSMKEPFFFRSDKGIFTTLFFRTAQIYYNLAKVNHLITIY
jgi:hypothetical protein